MGDGDLCERQYTERAHLAPNKKGRIDGNSKRGCETCERKYTERASNTTTMHDKYINKYLPGHMWAAVYRTRVPRGRKNEEDGDDIWIKEKEVSNSKLGVSHMLGPLVPYLLSLQRQVGVRAAPSCDSLSVSLLLLKIKTSKEVPLPLSFQR